MTKIKNTGARLRSLRRLLTILLAALPFFVRAEGRIVYRFPVDRDQEVTDSYKPIRPLPPPDGFTIHTFDSLSPFDAVVVNIQRQADGRYLRTATTSVDYVQDTATTCSEELTGRPPGIQAFINGSILESFDASALGEMQARKTIPRGESGSFFKGTTRLSPEQIVYLESYSFFTASELKTYFGNTLLWSRIAEVIAPPGLAMDEVKRLVATGDPSIKVKIRRANLRVVDSDDGYSMSSRPLPYQAEKQSAYLNDFAQFPAAFELGRLSQISGQDGEARQLAALAAIVILERLEAFYPSGLPPERATIFLHSARPGTTRGYQELGGEIVSAAPDGKNTLLKMTAATYINKVWMANPLSDFNALSALSEAPDYLAPEWATRLLKVYRQSFELRLNLNANGTDLTVRGPLIVQFPTGQAIKSFQSRIEHFDPKMQETVLNMVAGIAAIESTRSHSPDQYTEEIPGFKEEWHDHPNMTLISGLDPYEARSSTNGYVRSVLLGLRSGLQRNFILSNEFGFAVRAPELIAQFHLLDLKPYKVNSGAEYYKLTWADLDGIGKVGPTATKNVKLTPGKWQRLFDLRYLTGL